MVVYFLLTKSFIECDNDILFAAGKGLTIEDYFKKCSH